MSINNRTGSVRSSKAVNVAPLIVSFVVGIVLTFLLLLFFSWLYTRMEIPAWWAVPLATAAVCLGSFATGNLLTRNFKKNGLFCGLCAGGAFFVLYLAAALLNGQFEFSSFALIKLVCYLLAGAFGGIMGIAAIEKKPASRRPK